MNRKEFCRLIKEKRNASDVMGQTCGDRKKNVNNDLEKAEMFNKYVCSEFGKKEEDVFISHEDVEILSTLLETKKEVKQLLLGINTFYTNRICKLAAKSLPRTG